MMVEIRFNKMMGEKYVQQTDGGKLGSTK